MRRIPSELRIEMDSDPYYWKCALEPFTDNHVGEVEWHHSLIWGGRQINERWAIIPLCKLCHRRINKPNNNEFVEWITLSRATPNRLSELSKAYDYCRRREYLIKTYGIYKEQ